MFDSHGDVLAIKVHKPNSLDHLRRNRPRTAMQRPGTAHTSHMPLPASAQLARVRPQSAAPRLQPYSQPGTFSDASSYSTKSNAQKNIDGELGPKMIGVTTYPYSNPQRQYLQDFRALAAKTITHPYIATAGNNAGSSPHDLLAGTNFDDDRFSAQKKWRSEAARSYIKKSIVESKGAYGCGIRSEQITG